MLLLLALAAAASFETKTILASSELAGPDTAGADWVSQSLGQSSEERTRRYPVPTFCHFRLRKLGTSI